VAIEFSPNLRGQLNGIEPSVDTFGVQLYPCSAQLHDGTLLECVYFVDVASFERFWGSERPGGGFGRKAKRFARSGGLNSRKPPPSSCQIRK